MIFSFKALLLTNFSIDNPYIFPILKQRVEVFRTPDRTNSQTSDTYLVNRILRMMPLINKEKTWSWTEEERDTTKRRRVLQESEKSQKYYS